MSTAARGRTARRRIAGLLVSCTLLVSCVLLACASLPPDALAGEILTIEVKAADARLDPKTKQSIIFVKLTEESKRLVAEMTQRNIGKATEFRVDGKVLTKPIIREPLLAGVFEIAGNLSLSEAKEIAKRMATFGTKVEIEVFD